MAGPAHRHRDRGLTLAPIAAIGLVWLAAGCRDQAPAQQGVEEQPVVEVEVALEVGVSGCHGLVENSSREHVCLTRKPKPLYLWLDGSRETEVELQFAGRPIAAAQIVHPKGLLLEVKPSEVQGRLELETPTGVWALDLEPVSESYEALRESMIAKWRAGDAAAALAQLEGAKDLSKAESELLGFLGARIALAVGDYERVFATARQLAGSSTVSCVGSSMLLVAYIQLHLRPDFNAAEQSLRAAETVQHVDLDTRIGAMYLNGAFQHWLGHIDESLAAFEGTARLAQLIGDDDQLASALVMQAVALARLGRFAEAETLANDVEQRATNIDDASLALDIRSSVAWIAVLRREGDPSLPDPTDELLGMIGAYAERNDRRNLANRRLDLALTLVQNAEFDAAATQLSALDTSVLDPELLVWFELTSARIDLHRGRMRESEEHLDRALVLAELNQDRELEWHVVVASGELERARGHGDAALERFMKASRITDELALSIAGDAGRSTFVTTHSRADVALIELLLERGDEEAAVCAAIASRVRHLRGLWAKLRPPLPTEAEVRYRDLLSRHRERKQAIEARLEKSWELSTSELRVLNEEMGAESERADRLLAEATTLLEDGAPTWSCERVLPHARGEAVLTMVPGTDGQRWTALLAQRENNGELSIDIAHVVLASTMQVDLAAAAMLEQLESALVRCQNLRVIPVGAFAAVDFSRLWWARGHMEPSIVYSLGLGTPEEGPLERRAAVIAGSTNLATVEREVIGVGGRLAELGWTVEPHWDPASTIQPHLLHYAGHGFSGGKLGWQSAIEVPGFGRVSSAQIVGGQRSPEIVVLGACGAARVTTSMFDGGMNLAAAFLLAGARLVIAPVEDVEDVVGLELSLNLYRELNAADPAAFVRALARVQQERVGSFATWRAWVP